MINEMRTPSATVNTIILLDFYIFWAELYGNYNFGIL